MRQFFLRRRPQSVDRLERRGEVVWDARTGLPLGPLLPFTGLTGRRSPDRTAAGCWRGPEPRLGCGVCRSRRWTAPTTRTFGSRPAPDSRGRPDGWVRLLDERTWKQRRIEFEAKRLPATADRDGGLGTRRYGSYSGYLNSTARMPNWVKPRDPITSSTTQTIAASSRHPAMNPPTVRPEAEVRSLPVPQPQSGRCGRAEQPELPRLRPVPQHLAAVRDPVERSDTDVETVCQQAEAREETQDERPWKPPTRPPLPTVAGEVRLRRRVRPRRRSAGSGCGRVGPRDGQRVQDDAGDPAAGHSISPMTWPNSWTACIPEP